MNVEVKFDKKNGYIQVKGELTKKTVTKALALFVKECKPLTEWVIDFSMVTRVDSTALAFLIELKRNALKNKRKLSFIYLPASLITIAKLSQ